MIARRRLVILCGTTLSAAVAFSFTVLVTSVAVDSHGSEGKRLGGAVRTAAGQPTGATQEALVADMRRAADRDADSAGRAVEHDRPAEWLYDGLTRAASV